MLRIGPLVTAARTSLTSEREFLDRAMRAELVAAFVVLLMTVAALFLVAAVFKGPG